MFAIIGIVVVLGAVIGGYILEGGNLSVLFQPIEVLIIMGAALGGFAISAPQKVIIHTIKELIGVFTAKDPTKELYLELLLTMNELFRMARRDGLISVEGHVNKPHESAVFKKYPGVLANTQVLAFLCDNLKVYITSGMEPKQMEEVMDTDLEAQEKEGAIPATGINRVADSLPGLGIVAAVLGVVLTMGKITEPPEVLGHSIGAALVGTFLGVLLCYGFVGPLAANVEHRHHERMGLLEVVRVGLLSTVAGAAPVVALEFARRAIPLSERPSFEELEAVLRKG